MISIFISKLEVIPTTSPPPKLDSASCFVDFLQKLGSLTYIQSRGKSPLTPVSSSPSLVDYGCSFPTWISDIGLAPAVKTSVSVQTPGGSKKSYEAHYRRGNMAISMLMECTDEQTGKVIYRKSVMPLQYTVNIDVDSDTKGAGPQVSHLTTSYVTTPANLACLPSNYRLLTCRFWDVYRLKGLG